MSNIEQQPKLTNEAIEASQSGISELQDEDLEAVVGGFGEPEDGFSDEGESDEDEWQDEDEGDSEESWEEAETGLIDNVGRWG